MNNKSNYNLDSKEIREKVADLIKLEDLGFLKVTNTKYAKDIKTNEGITYTARVDIVILKDDEVNAQILSEEYNEKIQEKQKENEEKQAKKQAKILKDEAKRRIKAIKG